MNTDSYSENMERNVKAWCVGFVTTDSTDYTDCFSEDVDIPCLGVTRKFFEHGFHGFFLGTRISLFRRDA